MTVRTAGSSSPATSGSTVTAYCIAQTTIPPSRATTTGDRPPAAASASGCRA
jgi:hypothetical protein